MLFTFAEYFLQINFISLDALLKNSEQIKLSEFLKRNKNLTFLRNTWCSTGSIPNIIWHWSVTYRDLVRKIFIKTRVTAKDTELYIAQILFCCLQRNIEASCHKQDSLMRGASAFVSRDNKRRRLVLSAMSITNSPQSGGTDYNTSRRSGCWQHAMKRDIGR